MGITAEHLLHDIAEASLQFKSQFKSVIQKYGFTYFAPYQSELETLYDDALSTLQKLSNRFELGIIVNQSGDLLSRLKHWN